MRSVKMLLPALLLACPAALAAAPDKAPAEKKEAGDVVVITAKDADKKVAVKEGDTVQVKLLAQGGVPFAWVVVKNDDKVLVPKGKPVTERIKGEKPRPGGSQLRVFTFTAAAAGASALELHYLRFGKEPPAARKFAVTVEVKKR
jgi:predicted secreted protein